MHGGQVESAGGHGRIALQTEQGRIRRRIVGAARHDDFAVRLDRCREGEIGAGGQVPLHAAAAAERRVQAPVLVVAQGHRRPVAALRGGPDDQVTAVIEHFDAIGRLRFRVGPEPLRVVAVPAEAVVAKPVGLITGDHQVGRKLAAAELVETGKARHHDPVVVQHLNVGRPVLAAANMNVAVGDAMIANELGRAVRVERRHNDVRVAAPGRESMRPARHDDRSIGLQPGRVALERAVVVAIQRHAAAAETSVQLPVGVILGNGNSLVPPRSGVARAHRVKAPVGLHHQVADVVRPAGHGFDYRAVVAEGGVKRPVRVKASQREFVVRALVGVAADKNLAVGLQQQRLGDVVGSAEVELHNSVAAEGWIETSVGKPSHDAKVQVVSVVDAAGGQDLSILLNSDLAHFVVAAAERLDQQALVAERRVGVACGEHGPFLELLQQQLSSTSGSALLIEFPKAAAFTAAGRFHGKLFRGRQEWNARRGFRVGCRRRL